MLSPPAVLREQHTGRLRAGPRGLLAAGIAVGLWLLWPSTATVLAVVPEWLGPVRILYDIFGDALRYGIATLVVLGVSTRLDRRPYTAYGLDVDRTWLRNAVVGTAISLVAVGLSVTYADWRGLTDVTILADLGGVGAMIEIVVILALLGVILLSANVFEEIVFRGILLQNFSEGLYASGLTPGRAVAVGTAGSLLVFGAFHLVRGPVVAVDAIVVGGTFALAYLLTGQLGLAVGIHFGRLPMAILIAGEEIGVELAAMTVPDLPGELLVYLEFTFLQLAITVALMLLWVSASQDDLGIATEIYQESNDRSKSD